MTFRTTVMSIVLAIGTIAGAGLAPSAGAASSVPASDVGILGCQPNATPLVYRYHLSGTGVGTWVKTCSGNYPLNSSGIVLEAGAWSGWFTAAGIRQRFCNYDVWRLNDARVTRIEMSPTKVAGCP
jgi:hypothetical protein